MKKALAITIAVFSITLTSLLMPFSVHANGSLPAPFIGWNVYQISYDTEYKYTSLAAQSLTLNSDIDSLTCLSTNSSGACTQFSMSDFTSIGYGTRTDLDFTLSVPRQNINSTQYTWYLYEIELVLDNYYVGYVDLSITDDTRTYSSTVYVNGTSFKFTTTYQNTSFSITAYDLNLLDSDKIMWLFPIESFPYIKTINDQNLEQVGISSLSNYSYPIFVNDPSKYIARYTYALTTQTISVIFGLYSSSITQSNFNNYFTYNSHYTLEEYIGIMASTGFRIIHLKFRNDGQGYNLNLQLNQNINFIPIYIGPTGNNYISTDFALNYGLSNRLLDNLDIIANGTNQSNSAVSDFNVADQSMNDTISDYNTIEGQFVDDFDDNISAITPSDNSLSLMGSRFLNSANWVKTQFDRMTTGTPFGSVLGFSLVLGLGLLIIGRVFG